ncbi:hypothetical protein SAMN04487764_0557 [Gillisia sp. Hel1_33_143]|uniref:hypothetical protein n=1 Tax=Gillisia sp. Hel1_33_143 TaxID=1336796 RepID=UPI00087927FB|nr:hypothetical protein [Gillisia sp. Hel1_33_143]SDR75691.1 hypothetical protein SAMN04487764_0557 [Gillisia sp. Hel1_33_143]
MKAATVSQIKKELKFKSTDELMELCLRLSKFKKENKELLTYMLFESADEEVFIESVKAEMDADLENINTKNFYYIKKSLRKILKNVKKYIRYSPKKETEIELLIYFCEQLKDFKPSIKRNATMMNLYNRQVASIKKTLSGLHEDLQFDYEQEIEELEDF